MSRENQALPQDRDWYSVSVASVRRTVLLFVLVLTLLGGSLIYQRWEKQQLSAQAQLKIADATQLARQLENREDYQNVRNENFAAWEDLENARSEYDAGRFRPALDRANSSLGRFQRILNIETGDSQEEGSNFVSVQGGVEYRRGSGAWRRARPGATLRPGDWVKTSGDGTAELRNPDGSTVVLRPDTMIHFDRQGSSRPGGGSQVTDLVFGQVDLDTISGGKVTTPKSEANVRASTEASVSFDRDQGTSRFAAYGGDGLEVTAENGQTQEVGALQQVSQVGDLLLDPVSLPGRPTLGQPADQSQIDFRSTSRLALRWRPVSRATRYALQVSRNQLFADTVVSSDTLRRTSATLDIRGEGVFYWQVAGISSDGSYGPWSEPRQFRIASLEGGSQDDSTPPMLEIEEIQTFGKRVLVSGVTERGATVRVNGESVTVQVDGTFYKTIEMNQVGFAFLEVVATDPWQNPTEVKRRVFIDAF